MRRNRFGGKKEKTVMLLSSVFVLAALTATGLFIRGKSEEKKDGYVVDFSAIENEAQGETADAQNKVQNQSNAENETGDIVSTDDLDYDPYFQEANSQHVENPGQAAAASGQDKAEGSGARAKTGSSTAKEEAVLQDAIDTARVEEMEQMEDTLALATSTSIQPALTFGDDDTLAWPVVGNVLINYSMDKTIYFPTLQQYKYNPAIVIAAVEGETITAAADGKVISVFNDPEIGSGIVMELGGGYEATYGQLKDITVSEGGYVTKGDLIGSVAAPTKYYILEGSNIYFKLTKDGVPVNPMTKMNETH